MCATVVSAATAPYLPWALLMFSLLLGSSPVVDLLGMAAGHTYYFFEDVYPKLTEKRDSQGSVIVPGYRLLRTPRFISALFPLEDGDESGDAHPQV